MLELEGYRDRAREFISELNYEKYLHLAGLKDKLEVEPIYRRYAGLLSEDAVRELRERHGASAPDDEKRLRHILNFAIDHAVWSSTLVEEEKLATLRSTEPISVEGQSLSFHYASVLLANERDRTQREAIHKARLSSIVKTNDTRIERLKKLHERSATLFPGSYIDLYQLLYKLNFPVLRTQIQNFLTASESYYCVRLERYAQRILGIRADDVAPWDVQHLFRGHLYDSLFPEARMLSVLKRTLMGMGFDLKKQRNIMIDSTDRPNKSSMATCVPVRVPEQVYLVIRPQGGVSDFLTLFHEAGHAQHYGNTSPAECVEFKYLGDAAVRETYGFLFQYLTLNEDWLVDFLKVPPDHEFRDFNQFRKLYLLRRYAGRFLFELELHGSADLADPALPQHFSETLKKAIHLPVSPENYLYEMEDGFAGTRFLRAWIFEAELRQILVTRYGPRWYSRPSAGDFLRELWSYGLRYDCDELAQRIRQWGLNLGPITQELRP